MFIPVKLEAECYKFPVSNYIIIALTVFFFFFTLPESNYYLFENMVLTGFNPKGLFGNIFLHADIMHLAGNMLFLFVFGSAICVVFGNIVYPIVYVLLGVIASVIHLAFHGGPAVGASGAISGLMGLSLIWFPRNKVRFFYYIYFYSGTFRLNVIYVVIFYFVMDIAGIVSGGDNIAHFAHLGGLIGGMLIGILLLILNVLSIGEVTLIDALTKKEKRPVNKNYIELIEEAEESKMKETLQLIEKGNYNEQPVFIAQEAHSPEINFKADPKFRILRFLKNEKEVKCFIINEGDTINDVSVHASDGEINCEIIPAKEFKSKATGVLRFENLTSPEKVKIRMKFNNFQIKDFIYDPVQNKISGT